MRADAATLRLAVLPRAGLAADVVLVAAGAALIAASAQVAIPLPFTPVPITGQTFAVLLAGAALGAARGGSSGLVYLLAGAAGAPVYADGAGGWEVVAGASGGYLLAFPVAAALTGRLAEQRWDRRFSSALGAMALGSVVIYALGLAWLAIVLGTGPARTLELGFYPFLAGDLLKLGLAAALLPGAWRLVERAEGGRDQP